MKEILITSTALILALLVLRQVFREVLSRRVQYALWALVLARLLVPVSLPAVNFSLLTASQPVQQAVSSRFETIEPMYVPVDRAPIEQHPTAPDLAPAQAMAPTESRVWVVETENTAVEYRRLTTGQILSMVWKAGMIAVGAFFLVSNLRFYFRLKKHRREWQAEGGLPHAGGNHHRKVYLVENGILPSPCLFGGSIYLTPAVAEDRDKLRHVLAHEETHARHWDPLWSLLRCVCLTIYWFDPFVWIAAWCSKADCELACDEGALARLDEADRIPYGRTLLSLIPVKRLSNPLLTATTMTAGKKQLKDRITRIAQKPRQLMAAALAVAVLAGVVSACTFTGAKTSESPESSQGPTESTSRPLSGAEVRWFNEKFFNSSAVEDENPDPYAHYSEAEGGGIGYYNVRNQFANPINLYDKPEDIDLFDLFYLEGSFPSDEEVRTILDTDPDELPCGAYKFTTAEMDAILKANTGLTTADTAKKGLDLFKYDEATDAYYWAHGDTNYCTDLNFLCGTREGGTVKLYHNSNFSGSSWYCVTLAEQADGSYWFQSNQKCEHPAIPPVMPDRTPDAAISVMDLEPYTAEAVVLENRPASDFDGSYENRLENWNFDGRSVMVYKAVDGIVYAAYVVDDVYYVFLSGLSEERSHVFFYNDLFGHDGFYVDYYGQYSERSGGPIRDYYYFNDDDVLTLLARCQTHGGVASYQIDLDGDGQDELVSSRQMFFERDGLVYEAQLDKMLTFACPELSYWDWEDWDPYARRLYVNGLSDWDNEGGAVMWERYLYFDGENILSYRVGETAVTDHVSDGLADGVPPEVVAQARELVAVNLEDNGDGTYSLPDYHVDSDLPIDDWRLDSLSGPTVFQVGDATVEVWSFGGMAHVTDPKKFQWAGGSYINEDGWAALDHSGFFGRMAFLMEGNERRYLFCGDTEASIESVSFREWLYGAMEQAEIDLGDTVTYAALEFQLALESTVFDEVRLHLKSPRSGGAYVVPSDQYNGPYYVNQLRNTDEVVWVRAETPDKEPDGPSVVLTTSDWYSMIRVWKDTDLVLTKQSNQEPQCYRVTYRGDIDDDVYAYRALPYYQLRTWYDEAEYDALRERCLALDPRLTQDFNDDFKLSDWSRAWAEQYEAAHGLVDPDSSFAFSWQKVLECEVVDQTADSLAIWYTLAFTPANEEAFRSCWAGNTSEFKNYSNPDPEWGVPKDALYYTRVLHLQKRNGTWILMGGGTG